VAVHAGVVGRQLPLKCHAFACSIRSVRHII
jgi:hypothetical protein